VKGNTNLAPRLVKAKGNMYPWVTHMWPCMVGCPHQCPYCYAAKMRKRWGYTFPKKPIINWKMPNFGNPGKVIFVCHTADLFAAGVPGRFVDAVLSHCRNHPEHRYVFQTKDPDNMSEWIYELPKSCMVGTTIETDIGDYLPGNAPSTWSRSTALRRFFERPDIERFVTIEPIIEFNLVGLASMVVDCRPSFVNIGADSKGTGLREPSREKVLLLIDVLIDAGIEVRRKTNLERLTSDERDLSRVVRGKSAMTSQKVK